MCAQNGRARERKVGGMEQKKDRSVLIISAVIVAAFVIFGAVAPEALNEVANVLFTVFTVDFGWLYLLVVFVMVIYAVAGLALGYFAFRLDRPFLVSSAFEPLLGEKAHGPIGKAIDILAVFATIFGVATSLGLGAVQITGGLNYVYGIEDTTVYEKPELTEGSVILEEHAYVFV